MSQDHIERAQPASVAEANRSVLQLLEEGKSAGALALLESALARWPRNQRLLLTKGEVLAASGSDKAAEHYAGLLSDPKAVPWAVTRLRELLEKEPLELDAALKVGAQIAAADIEPRLKQPLLDLLLEREEPSERMRLLETIAPAAGLHKYEWKLAVARIEQGDPQSALALLSRAMTEGRTSPHGTTLLSDLLATCGKLPEAIETLEAAIMRHPDHPDLYRRLIFLLQRERAFGKAGAVMGQALERWPSDWMLLHRLNRLPLEPGQFERIFAIVSRNAPAAAENDERFCLQFALACLHAREIERGLSLLARPFQDPVSHMAAPVLGAVRSRPVDFWRDRSRLVDDRSRDVQWTLSPRPRATLVLPTGISFGYLPLSMIDALFAEHDVNVVYLRDFNKRAYLRGVVGLGSTEAETLGNLKPLLDRLDAARTIIMGSSQGGFAALRYGALLETPAAVSFSGPTDLSLYYDKVRPSAWNPNYFIKLSIEREADLPMDVAPLVAASRSTRFYQFYGAQSADDVRQAERLRGLPQVTLEAVPEIHDHFVLDHMIGSGWFDRLLERVIEG